MRVIVTRPEPGLARTMARLGSEGYDPVALPLTRVRTLGEGVEAARSRRPDVYVATSAAALDAVGAGLDLTRPIWTVGPATAERARKAGFADVRKGPGEGRGLARTIIEREAPDIRLLYLAGRERTAAFEEILTAAGRTIDVVEVYDVEPIAYDADRIAGAFEGDPAVMLFSAGAARALIKLVTFEIPFVAICMSENVAACLPENRASNALVADVPSEDGMLAALARIRNQRR